jgi:hypothetical protein
MSKYSEVFQETQDLYDELLEKTGLSHYINVSLLSDDKSKEIFKISRCCETEKHKTGDDINITINEKIFDQLTQEQRVIVAEESLAGLHFDSEKDKLVISKPDVVTFSGVLSKHTYEKWLILSESLKTLYNVDKQKEDESKAVTK